MTHCLHPPAAFAESPASGLVCRECGTQVDLAPVHVCVECFAPLEVAYDEDRLRLVTRESIAAGPQTIWRYAGLLPAGQDLATRVDIGAGMTKLRNAPQPGQGARHEAALGQGRQRQPDPLLQGPGRLGRAVRGPGLRLHHRQLRQHRQPRQLGRRARRRAPACARRVHPATTSSRARSCRPPSTARRSSPWRAATTTSTGSAARSPRTRTGPSSTSTSGRTTPRAARRSGYEVAEQLGWRLPQQVVLPMASGLAAHQGGQGVPRARPARPGRGDALQGLRRAGHRLLADRHGVRERLGHRQAGQAQHHRPEPGDRQPGRRPVRARRRAPHRRGDGPRQRRAGRRGDPAAGPHRGASSPRPPAGSRSRRCGSCSSAARSTRTPRRSSTTPATASRPSTPSPAWSARTPPSRPRTAPSPAPVWPDAPPGAGRSARWP